MIDIQLLRKDIAAVAERLAARKFTLDVPAFNALEAERKHGKTPTEAIYEGCIIRFRPIMMTTMAALLGAMPIAAGYGAEPPGAEIEAWADASIEGLRASELDW